MDLLDQIKEIEALTQKLEGKHIIMDPDTLLKDLMDGTDEEFTGIAHEIFGIYRSTDDPESFCKLFETLTGTSFPEYLSCCRDVLSTEIDETELKNTAAGKGATIMHTVSEVADYYLAIESMSPKKLQKIVYYAYSWTLTLLNDSDQNMRCRLFQDQIEAWVHGPVIPALYEKYKAYTGSAIPRISDPNPHTFSDDERSILDQVWSEYGFLSANDLEVLSRGEAPWLNARSGLPAYAPSSGIISDEDIFEYYSQQAGE